MEQLRSTANRGKCPICRAEWVKEHEDEDGEKYQEAAERPTVTLKGFDGIKQLLEDNNTEAN